LGIFVCLENKFIKIVEWSGRHSTSKGNRGRAETPKRREEAQLPPCGKHVSAAQWNELVFTT
jgi:hypothetical protein